MICFISYRICPASYPRRVIVQWYAVAVSSEGISEDEETSPRRVGRAVLTYDTSIDRNAHFPLGLEHLAGKSRSESVASCSSEQATERTERRDTQTCPLSLHCPGSRAMRQETRDKRQEMRDQTRRTRIRYERPDTRGKRRGTRDQKRKTRRRETRAGGQGMRDE